MPRRGAETRRDELECGVPEAGNRGAGGRSRWTWALAAAIGILGLSEAGGLGPGPAAQAAPNILVIVTDDQRATDTLRFMPAVRSQFRRRGREYKNAFAVTPLCCPSRATILTGRYAHNHRIRENGGIRRLDKTTMFPRLLRAAGYGTAMVGKFLNGWPQRRRPPYFDRWALLKGDSSYVDPRFNLNGRLVTRRGYQTRIVRRLAVRFLRRFERDDQAPWLLYVAPWAAHAPWIAERRYAHAPVGAWAGNPAVFERDRSDKPPAVRSVFFTIAGARLVRAGQLRALMSVDDLVKGLFAELGRLGERRNTLAIYTSDNGYMWTEHHVGGDWTTAGEKRLPYDQSVKVPFLLRWPGHVRAGATSRRMTGTVDIAPTVLEAAGIPPDPAKPPLDGRSLLSPNPRRRILLEYWREGPRRWPTWASVRTRSYQYTEYYANDAVTRVFREYYRLRRDPWQLRNLLHDGDPRNNPNVRALAAQLAHDRRCRGTETSRPCP